MSSLDSPSTRRDFVGRAALLGAAAALPTSPTIATPAHAAVPSDWDLAWVARLARTTDRAVFDMPAIDDGTVLDLATRYLDNCDAVYGAVKMGAIAVLNVRTRAVALGLDDATWARFALGAEYDVKDPATKQTATRNPYLDVPAGAYPGTGAIRPLMQRGAIVLVCDFALGHLANRLATKAQRAADDVHRELRAGFVPGAFAVPSGIFGMAKAQNAGCALVKL